MADNQIKIEISAGTDELIKALNSADKAAVKFSANVVGSFAPIRTEATKTANAVSGAFSDTFKDIVKGNLVANVLSDAFRGVSSSIISGIAGTITAANEQENALNRLGQALRATGSYSKQAIEDFSNFSSELQKNSVYGDEVVLAQIAIAKSFGTTNEQAKNLVQAAANLTSTFGGSLEENVSKLAKTLDGTAGKLNEQIPALRSLTAEQLKTGAAIDVVNSKFAGAAANELNSFQGKTESLKNAISDLQEELGSLVTGSDTVKNSIGFVSGIFQGFTQLIVSAKEESARNNGTLQETSGSIDRLSERYALLTTQIEIAQKQEKQLNESPNFFEKFIGLGDEATKTVKNLQAEQAKLFSQISNASAANAAIPSAPTGGGSTVQSEAEKAAAAKLISDKEAVNQQIAQQQQDFNIYMSQLALSNDKLTQDERTLEYENLLAYEQAKIDAVQQAELAKAQLITDAGLKKSAIEAANDKADYDRQKVANKNKIDLEKDLTKMQRQEADTRLAIASNFINAGLALTKEGSIAQKGLSIASATISTYTAATHALEDTRPAFLGPAVAASIVAAGLANVAKIAGAKFATGGIVSGYSTSGDKVPALVNSGEMILNKNQQTELFGIANGTRSAGNGSDIGAIIAEIRNIPIIVQANGREIARLIRDEQKNGFEVFA